jgi:bifunctional DNase/RNase
MGESRIDRTRFRSQNREMSEPVKELRVEIKGLMLDPSSNVPIVILRDTESQLFLPIWIGLSEANAIASRIEGIEPPRPMTHDLLRSVFEHLGGEVEKIVISDLKESTFFAVIHVRQGSRPVEIDARPSDAIALALRVNAPIFVLRAVLDKAQAVDLASQATDEEKLKKWLEEISPDELGKWTM